MKQSFDHSKSLPNWFSSANPVYSWYLLQFVAGGTTILIDILILNNAQKIDLIKLFMPQCRDTFELFLIFQCKTDHFVFLGDIEHV